MGCYYDLRSKIFHQVLKRQILRNLEGRLRAMLGTMRVVMKAFGDLVKTECGGFVFMVLEGIIKVATFF